MYENDYEKKMVALGFMHPLKTDAEIIAEIKATASAHKQYIGTKMIQATPALRIEDENGKVRIELLSNKPITSRTDTVDMGYKVIYPDGYESWSPQDVFEQAYRPTTGMNFGLALEAAKMGKKIARRGWNGKDMLVICQFTFSADDVRSYLCMKDENDLCQVWGAPQVDMLADDWYIVE